MKWIGLTGGLGTGKSTVSRLLREEGYIVLDADEIAKRVVARGTPGLKSVAAQFGSQFVTPDGDLDRAKMAELVFKDPKALLELEKIIHPLVQLEIQEQKKRHQQSGESLLFYDVPLLFEKNITGFDQVVVVSAPEKLQFERLRKRNQWSDEEIRRRLNNQRPLSEKIQKADFVVENDSDLVTLKKRVQDLIQKLKL